MARFICLDCGKTFDEPKIEHEYRGEYWGFPSYEDVAYCPYCMGDFEEYREPNEYWVSAYNEFGTLFGDTIKAEDAQDLFDKFYAKYPDCDIADYGCYGEEG